MLDAFAIFNLIRKYRAVILKLNPEFSILQIKKVHFSVLLKIENSTIFFEIQVLIILKYDSEFLELNPKIQS